MSRLLATGMFLVVVASICPASEVWRSNFDSSADGVVDIWNQNSAKATIGPAAGGKLQITNMDNSTNAYTPDKAGRPLGATVGAGNSFSGLYQFQWSGLNQSQTQAYEMAGFLGSDGNSTPQTRQVMTALIGHWKVGADNYITLDMGVGGIGISGFGYKAGTTTWLANPSDNYQLTVGYDGTTRVLTLGLYDGQGNLVTQNVGDLDTDLPGLTAYGSGAYNGELNAMAFTHLGWSDYTYNGGDRSTVWQTDSLAYFNTATGAVEALLPEPASLILLAGGLVVALRRRAGH